MKGSIKIILTVLLTFLTINLVPTTVSAHALTDFDMKTANAPTVTAASIDKNFKDNNAGSSLQGTGKVIMELSEATGINAAFFAAKMMNESDWGRRDVDNKYYNYGNIFGVPGDAGTYEFMQNGQDRVGAAFSTPETGLKATIELLDQYYTKGINGSGPLKTLKEALTKYAPESDNNSHDTIMDNIQIIAKGFGQDLSTGGSINLGSGEYESDELTATGKKVGTLVEPMIEFGNIEFISQSAYTKGVQTPEGIGSNMVAGFARFSSSIFENSKVITSFMAVALIGYMILSIGLVLIGYNGLFGGNDIVTKASNAILGEGIEYNRQGLFKLFKRTIIGIFILALVISGVYALGFVAIYGAVMYF